MRRPLSFAVGCILALCSIHLRAQTSTGFSDDDKYKAVKAILQQFYENGTVPSGIDKDDIKEGKYNLGNASGCAEADLYVGAYRDDSTPGPDIIEKPQHNNDDIAGFLNNALDMVVWSNDLRKLGVPEKIWRPVLEKYDVGKVDDITAELNASMARAGRSKPKFIYDRGCGSGGVDAHFALAPPDGQLFLIPVFLYKLCEVQHLSPLNLKSCNRWKEVINEQVFDVSGDYMYLARWGDGVARCGSITYNDFQKNEEEYEKESKKERDPIVITKLRSPGCNPAW
jgi:hypothetical protein